MSKLFNNVVIIGTGLIGASVGLNLVTRRMASQVIGVGRSAANLKTARQRKAIHQGLTIRKTAELFSGKGAQVLRAADLILLATPVQTALEFVESIPRELIASLQPGAVMTDVGSTKQSIVKAAIRRIKGPATFIGGHPIAGRSVTGAQAALRDLFKEKAVILTPTKAAPAALRKVKRLWELQGARVTTMTAAKHDQLLAHISHLPQMVAYSLVNGIGDAKELVKFAGSGFRDTTRIAGSDPTMWRDISLDNRAVLLKAMQKFEQEWNELKKALKRGDGKRLTQLFARAKKRRDKFNV